MRGRTNIGGGNGFSTGTTVTGIVKSGETISAGKFVQCINETDQTPLEISNQLDDKASTQRYIFKLSDGRFVSFYGYTSASSYTRTQANFKCATVFSVGLDKPTLDFTSNISISNNCISNLWVTKIGTNKFAVVTMESVSSAWKIVIRKCVVDVTNNNVTWSDVGSFDISSLYPNTSYNATYKSQRFSPITVCSLGDGEKILVFYHTTIKGRIVDCSNGTIGSETALGLTNTAVATTYTNSTSNEYWNEDGDINNFKSINVGVNKIVLKFMTASGAVFVLLSISGSTITKLYEVSTGITTFVGALEKVTDTRFVYLVKNIAGNSATSCDLYFFTITNNSLQYIVKTIPLNKLCSYTQFSDVAISCYNEDTLYVLTLVGNPSYPTCVTKIDITDYSEPSIGDYAILQNLLTGSSVPSTYGGFIVDSDTNKGLYIVSKIVTKSSSSGSWYNNALQYCAVKVINGTIIPSGNNLVFTKHVNNITGVSKTAGASGEEITVYLPDAEE